LNGVLYRILRVESSHKLGFDLLVVPVLRVVEELYFLVLVDLPGTDILERTVTHLGHRCSVDRVHDLQGKAALNLEV